ncbi:molybdopterin-dependent oxidoreductase [Halorhabdus sp. BNX81]|uniref:molybdopterin-dependent oxidoreductase n=1 Tax=Halorhabdus sp. BNX81 TaxID=2980181 RepID=UPI0023DCEFF5|nr:molybdopterin-dependent oxidoreductase [Halorhabdus sp. BNX81]WEL20171.1 Periplasmic DMSO/TMAO reductase YedYZ, molybdopterin-dependent catalytic subunit [Halorhabdus sp. BNX81]
MDKRVQVFALAGISGVAGSYALAGYTRQFIVAPIDAVVVRSTPGPIVAWMITNVGDAGHLLHIALSMGIAGVLLGTTAVLGQFVGAKLDRWFLAPGVAGVLAWALTVAITTEPVLSLGAALPVALFTVIGAGSLSTADHDPSRRRALGSIQSAIGFVVVAGGAGWVKTNSDTETADEEPASDPPSPVTRRLEQADTQSLDLAADNVPGLVSSIGEFYNVDIAEFDPEIADDDWSMGLTGEVETEFSVTFEELTDRPTEHRYVTLRCVGENLNGRKLDTAVWTGTPIKPLLEEADPEGDCDCAMLRAEDGYFVQFPVEALEDAFLAWEMNGRPLPKSHGHPVRVLVPGHWGETNVKWLTEIELLDEAMDGYWEQRGWHGTGPVNTVAKLWDDTRLDDGRIEVAGHAYAGTRGIERVEVSTDGGASWTDATLSAPLPGEDVWRQWRHVYEPTGDHEVVVRAIDGGGDRQPRDQSDSFPSGATGWVSKEISA